MYPRGNSDLKDLIFPLDPTTAPGLVDLLKNSTALDPEALCLPLPTPGHRLIAAAFDCCQLEVNVQDMSLPPGRVAHMRSCLECGRGPPPNRPPT